MSDRVCRIFRTARFVWSHPLNRGSRLSAIARLVRWRAKSRLARGPVAFPFVARTRLVASPGTSGVPGLPAVIMETSGSGTRYGRGDADSSRKLA